MILLDHVLLIEKTALSSEILIIPSKLSVNLEILLGKNFPDKFCPVSGFSLNRPVCYIFFCLPCIFTQDDVLS